jgi:hypothetical protein
MATFSLFSADEFWSGNRVSQQFICHVCKIYTLTFTYFTAILMSEQAVTTSAVYLFRNLGSVFGIAAVSSLLQTFLSIKLPIALEGVKHSKKVSAIDHS